MNFEAIAAYSGAVGSIVAIIAVVADHLWARAANNRRDARQEYLANVSTPISEIMLEIVEFRCSVSEWVWSSFPGLRPHIQGLGVPLARAFRQSWPLCHGCSHRC